MRVWVSSDLPKGARHSDVINGMIFTHFKNVHIYIYICVCVFLSLYSPIHGSALAKCKELEVQRQSCITFVAGTCFIGLGNFNEGVCVRCIYWVWRRKGSGKEKRTTRMYKSILSARSYS